MAPLFYSEPKCRRSDMSLNVVPAVVEIEESVRTDDVRERATVHGKLARNPRVLDRVRRLDHRHLPGRFLADAPARQARIRFRFGGRDEYGLNRHPGPATPCIRYVNDVYYINYVD